MGRSVSYPSNAVVSFMHVDEMDECEWGDLVYNFRSHLKSLWPSVSSADEWIGREDHVLAENGHAQFGMSEYCGLVSYWMVPKQADTYYGDTQGLHDNWVAQTADRFQKSFGDMRKVGNFSNGGGIYERWDNSPIEPERLDGPVVINGVFTDG